MWQVCQVYVKCWSSCGKCFKCVSSERPMWVKLVSSVSSVCQVGVKMVKGVSNVCEVCVKCVTFVSSD